MHKNILFFISNASSSGGTERILSSLIAELSTRSEDYSILVVSLNGKSNSGTHYNYDCDVVYLEGESFFSKILDYRRLVKATAPHYVIDVDSILSLYSHLVRFTLPFLGTKIVTWEHFHVFENLGARRRDWGRFLASKLSHAIIVLTDEDKGQWEDKYPSLHDNDKLKRIYNLNSLSLRGVSKPSTENPIFLSAGRLVRQKGFDLLIEAWAKMYSDYNLRCQPKLKIAGKGKDRQKLEQMVFERGLNESVEILGEVEDISKLYASTYCYVVSSRFEGFGLTILEAMSFGVPVIAFQCPCGPKDLLADRYGVLVEKSNVDELAKEMSLITNDVETRNRLAELSHKRFSHFESNKIVEEWLSVFKS